MATATLRPLLLTMGDPTGIGPEVIVKALAGDELADLDRPLWVVGDVDVLQRAATVCAISCRIDRAADESWALTLGQRCHRLVARSHLVLDQVRYGAPDLACAAAMADYIDWAAGQCLAGSAAGLVTAPISKIALQRAGQPFPGHTELLAERCGGAPVVMMLAGSRLRVCLVTTHCALHEVPRRLSMAAIVQTLRITATALTRDFGLEWPRLAVLALNPHAGEAGLFGDEEERIIAPAIAAARAEGLDASGPHSADTLFWFASRGDYDAVICMYHDQGLIPLKLLHFEDGVNVTLGLPIVRTSVDHGTAYDLAGSGRANPASLVAAIRMAAAMANHRADAPRPA
ncbi:MAG: 4-hydroxythreonine-4-phosphate dehydrogenase PdxA [Desulfuromonadales bacterium]|nr:4-hydroxythreonine-4-phosphate dehydrogenase PdxA [Desulfuromonadales bacterium]